MGLSTFLFLLLGIAFTVYAVLDGFDLGIGILSLGRHDESWQKTARQIVTPFWDSNGVWLILGGGGLLAAFPMVYATVFSGFYLAVILLIIALLFRAISLEFHERSASNLAKRFWMWAFGLSSFVIALVLGIAFGNILQGIPLDASFNYVGSFWNLFGLFPVMVGVTTVLLFASHGSIWLSYKTQETTVSRTLWLSFLLSYAVSTLLAVAKLPGLLAFETPAVLLWLAVICLVGAMLWVQFHLSSPSRAFWGSCVMIFAMMALAGLRLFPNLVPSTPNPENSLTLWNAISSTYAQKAVASIVCVSLPCVFVFKLALYRTFRSGYATRKSE